MNLKELQIWVEGFNAGINRAPTKDQWASVLKEIKEARDENTVEEPPAETYDQFVDKYNERQLEKEGSLGVYDKIQDELAANSRSDVKTEK